MTYFALFTDELKARNLKLAILINYETFSFDIWLTARNRKKHLKLARLLEIDSRGDRSQGDKCYCRNQHTAANLTLLCGATLFLGKIEAKANRSRYYTNKSENC
ncbi:MAG: DUF7000 family protein [Opitutaceae bacterium]